MPGGWCRVFRPIDGLLLANIHSMTWWLLIREIANGNAFSWSGGNQCLKLGSSFA